MSGVFCLYEREENRRAMDKHPGGIKVLAIFKRKHKLNPSVDIYRLSEDKQKYILDSRETLSQTNWGSKLGKQKKIFLMVRSHEVEY